MLRKKFLLTTVAAVMCAMTAFASAASADTLTGAGSTLVAPLMQYWINGFDGATGNSVTYSSVGSGKGIQAISAGQVTFGASDAPMTTAQAAGCANCIQIPWALGAVGVGFNVPGVSKLKLTGPVLAGIYLGQITTWNNPAIAKLNKGVHLPALKISPIFRSDGSGDTYAFTNYLSHISPAFAGKVGVGTSVQFPAGAGFSGNLGVTNALQSTSGSIAYITTAYLIAHGLHAAAVQNRAGNYEYPNLQNIANAARFITKVPNGYSIVNPPKKAKIAYPISTFTYAIVPTNSSHGAALQAFITYAVTTGQKFGPSLDFVPLPTGIKNTALSMVKQIQ